MAPERDEIVSALGVELERWEALLEDLSPEQIQASRLPNGWSIKDLIAHLMAWQQVTRARLEAAQRHEAPALPAWLEGASPESEEAIDRFNARIYEIHRDRPWSRVHQEWREGFLEVMRRASELSDEDLLEPGRFPWLNGDPLVAVLHGTLEHHHRDHLGTLRTWIDENSA